MKLIAKRKVGIRDFNKDVFISVPKHNLKYKRGEFLLLNQKKILEIITNKEYTGDTLRILLFFMSITEYGNRIKYYTQKEIYEMTKVQQSKVSAAVTDLVNDKIIYKESRDYYFSNDLLIKGDENYKNK